MYAILCHHISIIDGVMEFLKLPGLNLNHFSIRGGSYNILYKAHEGSKVAPAINSKPKYCQTLVAISM